MARVSVASLGFDTVTSVYGQSFTPNVLGPDGTGSVGSATTAQLLDITFSYPTAPSYSSSENVYVYQSLLADPTDSCDGTGAFAASTSYADGSAFGPGTHTRTFSFSNVTLQASQTYYLYLPGADSVQYLQTSAYSGGQGIDADGDGGDFSLRFQVELNV